MTQIGSEAVTVTSLDRRSGIEPDAGSVTSGVLEKRGSPEASGTTKTSDCRMACAPNETSPARHRSTSNPRLEPLAIAGDEADQCNRRIAEMPRASQDRRTGSLAAYQECHTAGGIEARCFVFRPHRYSGPSGPSGPPSPVPQPLHLDRAGYQTPYMPTMPLAWKYSRRVKV